MLDQMIHDTGRHDVLLLGWSMGALVAWSYIANHGCARLSGLITADMSPRPANGDQWQLGLNGLTPARQQATTAEIHSNWPTAAAKVAATMFASPDGAPNLSREQAKAQVMANDPSIMARYWDEMMATDLRPAAAQVSVPWLITHGARSRVYPAATANWLAHHAPQAQVQSFANSGHSPHLEEPEAFADALKEFEASL
jgi:pimeloyl-[acyl-carrier protein] methyl ester esterase